MENTFVPASDSCRLVVITTWLLYPSISLAVFRSAAALFRASSHTPFTCIRALVDPPSPSWAELRGLFWAFLVIGLKKAQRLLSTEYYVVLLIVTTIDFQYQAPLFRGIWLPMAPMRIEVLFSHLARYAQAPGRGLRPAFTWMLPLLDGYHWRVATQPEARRTAQYLRLSASQAYG